jgi:hypothetical protein
MYQFFCAINNPHHENDKVLVGNHRDIFYKEIKHVQHGIWGNAKRAALMVVAGGSVG